MRSPLHLVLLLLPGCSDLVGADADLEATSSTTLTAVGETAKRGEAAGQQESTIVDATLVSVLLYHVAPGRRFSRTVLRQQRINTLNGGFLYVDSGSAALIDANGRQSNILVEGGCSTLPRATGSFTL